MTLPGVLAGAADSAVALGRVGKFLIAEELEESYTVKEESKYAIDVDGDFTWETAHKPTTEEPDPKQEKPKVEDVKKKEEKPETSTTPRKRGFFSKKKAEPVLPTTTEGEKKEGETEPPTTEPEKEAEKPFELLNVKLQVPRGSFVAIVGKVGSGKVTSP